MTKHFSIDPGHGGEGWRTVNELAAPTGSRFGADSECGQLRRVLLIQPDPGLGEVQDPAAADWFELPDYEILLSQWERLAETYERHGVEVVRTTAGQPSENAFFARDLFAMTPWGAILSRMASRVRAGEEAIAQRLLTADSVPIVTSVLGEGTFEGPDLMFFDRDKAFVATSVRSNEAGARQVVSALEQQGVDTILLQTTFGCGHLDGVVALPDRRVAVVFPRRFSFTGYETLRRHGYTVMELPDEAEAVLGMAINMVPLEPGLVLMPDGCPRTIDALRATGVHAVEVAVGEARKAGGAVHCLTAVLHRETCW